MDTLKKLMEIIFDTSSYRWKQGHTKKYEKLWSQIRDLTRSITENSENYDEKYLTTNLISMTINL